jgi:hypothetical protein
MSRKETLGFDRKLELAWLDAAAAAAARGDDLATAREQLFAVLDGVVAGNGPHSGRGKTITVLSRIWLAPASTEIGRRALGALDDAASPGERLAIHWAMCAATHPFFVDVVAAVGRLVRMQGDVSQAQVTRRVAETWGDRSTLHRAVQRVCRSLIAWGVLQETDVRGMYRLSPVTRAVRAASARLLIEAVLIGGRHRAAPIADIVRHPALFPFDTRVSTGELRDSGAFLVERQGLDVDIVRLSG